ncbi:MAG: UPF0280 family protein [Candidatus Omnitrophota bacterium]
MYGKRVYRSSVKNSGLLKFRVQYYESDLFICAESNLQSKAKELLVFYHSLISKYIEHNQVFANSLTPVAVDVQAPLIVENMINAALKAEVGPMACVAGAIAEFVGNDLLKYSKEIIVENGGDIFLSIKEPRRVGIFAGVNSIYNKIALRFTPEKTPCGICTSSGTIGHSLSFGSTMATVIIADSALVADGFATAIANRVKSDEDIPIVLERIKFERLIKAAVIITAKEFAVHGDIELEILDKAL